MLHVITLTFLMIASSVYAQQLESEKQKQCETGYESVRKEFSLDGIASANQACATLLNKKREDKTYNDLFHDMDFSQMIGEGFSKCEKAGLQATCRAGAWGAIQQKSDFFKQKKIDGNIVAAKICGKKDLNVCSAK